MSEMLDRITALIGDLDPNMTATSRGFGEAAVLLSALDIGADENRIVEALGFDPEFVGLVGSRLRAAGIWRDHDISPRHWEAWQDETSGGTAFWMDHGVATGALAIVEGGGRSERQYTMTADGKAMVERMMRDGGPAR